MCNITLLKSLTRSLKHYLTDHISLPINFQLKGSAEKPNISIYFFFPPITQWCSISNVLFTGGRGVSAFSVLKYYQLNINYSVNIRSKCLCIVINCSQLSKTYYNVLFGSSTRDRHARRHISADVQRITLNASSCITISGGRTEQLDIIAGFLPHHWLYE